MALHGRETFEGFVYLDIDKHPMVAWNTVRGTFCSADCLGEDVTQSAMSLSMTNMLKGYSWNRMRSELAIEAVRKRYHPEQVSRLRGIFVFDDVESVSKMWYGGGWGEHFNDEYLTDVGIASDRSSRVDANWITEIFDTNCVLNHDWFEKTNKYWAGEPHPIKEPIWERIVEGWATIWGAELKQSALAEIYRYWPKSIKLLEYSCNAAAIGSNDGISYSLANINNNFLDVAFYLRLIDAKKESTFKRMKTFFKSYPEREAIFPGERTLVVPDFSDLAFRIPLDKLKSPAFW